MVKYERKQEYVEAVQHLGDGKLSTGDAPEWLWEAVMGGVIGKLDGDGAIPLFDGKNDLMLPKGAWFVQGEDGRISVIGSKGFAEKYEKCPEAR